MAEVKKYLSLERLAAYDTLLKAKMAQDDAVVLDSAKEYTDEQINSHKHSWNDLEDKPFGEEKTIQVQEEIVTNLSTLWAIDDFPEEGTTHVNWDSVEYEFSYDNYKKSLQFGNQNIQAWMNPNTGEPFYITVFKNDEGVKLTFMLEDEDEHTVSIYTTGGIKTLDEKFIPDTIARKSDIENIDLTPYETKEDAAAKLDEAKAYADGKDTAIEAAHKAGTDAATAAGAADEKAVKAQGDVDALKTYVGTIPETATATDVIGYVQEKTAGIATSENLQELTDRVAQAETDIGNIEKDYLKAADKEELQGNIDTVSSAVELLTNGVSADEVDGVNDLIQYVKEHGTEVTGMKADIQANADAIGALHTVANTGSWNDLEDKPFYEEPNDYIIPKSRINGYEGDGIIYTFDNAKLEEAYQNGKTVTLLFDGEYYTSEVTIFDDENYIFTNYEVNRRICQGVDKNWYLGGEFREGKYYSIELYVAGNSKALDEKYIPDTIARVSDQAALAERVTTIETASATHALKSEVETVSDALTEYKDAHAGDYTNAQVDAAIKVVTDSIAALNDTYATDEELAAAIAQFVECTADEIAALFTA